MMQYFGTIPEQLIKKNYFGRLNFIYSTYLIIATQKFLKIVTKLINLINDTSIISKTTTPKTR